MNLPEIFIQSIQENKSFNEVSFRQSHQSTPQLTSVRINPKKINSIAQANFSCNTDKVPWSSHGYYLAQRPLFTIDPLFHAGAYYVQEASSMFLEEAICQSVDVTKDLKVLDLCAAPGGKSTLIQSIISANSLLVSNEVIKTRTATLSENISKWGDANVIVTNNDPQDFKRLQNYFDVVVVDAPCSGSGLFRKDANAIKEWSQNNVTLCAQRQQRILADVVPALKEGGVLIYSTCSYSKEEDEAVADWLMQQFEMESIQLKIDTEWGIVETVSEKAHGFGYKFYPDKVKGEGFFIAVFKKQFSGTGEINSNNEKKSKREKNDVVVSAKNIATLKPYLDNVGDFFFIKQHEDVIAMPLALKDELPIIKSCLYIKKAGIKVGAIIRDTLIPAHELAISNIISKNFISIDIDLETALQYLRRHEIKPMSGLQGWALFSYRQLPLGWIKVIGHRINNYYPAAWRILNK